MFRKKDFTAPFWIMIPVVLFQLLCLVFLIYMASSMLAHEREYERANPSSSKYPSPHIGRQYVMQSVRQVVTIIMLIAECILLWRIRSAGYARLLAVGYILPMIFVLAFLPILALYYGIITDFVFPNDTLYWIGIGVAHVFFAIMWWQARYRKTKFTQKDPANILDDYADKFE